MGRFLFSMLICSILLLPSALFAQSHNKNWIEAKTNNINFKAIASQPDIEVFSAPNLIKVKINQPTQIRLFTILGKLIEEHKLEPGTYEYHLDTHGIYIIKTDDMSCKVAV